MIDRNLRTRLGDAYVATIPLINLNVYWFIASLPLITLIPATAGLFYATNQLAHGKSAGWSTFVEGFRLYLRQCWAWGLLNVAVVATLITNFLYYTVHGSNLGAWARAVVLILGFLWLTLQLYTFPLMIEQEQPRLRTALRNSLVLLLRRPFYSFGMALVVGGIVLVSLLIILPAWIFITASICAYLANLATVHSIARITGKGEVEEEAEA